MLANSRSLSI